ncbi:MAG: hypothetical protein WKF81_11165, partial [Thermomicrobiales bacterium]
MASTHVRLVHLVVVIGLLLAWSGSCRVVSAQETTATARITLQVESTGAIDTASLESNLRPVIITALDELASLFDIVPTLPLTVTFGTAPDQATQQRWQSVEQRAWIDPASATAQVDLNAYLQLSPLEAGNVLRNLLAR